MRSITTVSVKLENELKKEYERTLDDLGLSMSAGFQAFAKAVVRKGGIPFEMVIDPFEHVEYQKELARRIDGYESGLTQMVDMTEEFE
jgi:DNA-damage-inducible protein J